MSRQNTESQKELSDKEAADMIRERVKSNRLDWTPTLLGPYQHKRFVTNQARRAKDYDSFLKEGSWYQFLLDYADFLDPQEKQA